MFHLNMVEWIAKQMNFRIGDMVRCIRSNRVGYITDMISLGMDVYDVCIQWLDGEKYLVTDDSIMKLN